MSRSAKNTLRLELRIDPYLRREITRAAKKEDQSDAEYIRAVLTRAIQRRKRRRK